MKKEKEEKTGWELTTGDWILTVVTLLILFVPVILGYVNFWVSFAFIFVLLFIGMFINWWKPDFSRRKK